jgi:hypothetical protein
MAKLKEHEQTDRRAQVAEMRRCGYDPNQIAHKLGVHVATIRKDLRILDERWYWESRRDTAAHMEEEIRQLKEMREQAWKAYHEYVNRHGEGHQNGYLTTVLNTTKQLHELLRLTETTGEIGGDGDVAPVVEVTVSTRDQADAIADGTLDFETFTQMYGEQSDGTGES